MRLAIIAAVVALVFGVGAGYLWWGERARPASEERQRVSSELEAAKAQQAGKLWRIGLSHVGLDHVPPSLDGLREGLLALGYEESRISTSTGATFPTKTQHALRRKRLCATESISSSRSRIRRRERRKPPPRKFPSSCCTSLPRSKTASSRASLTLAAISPVLPAVAITRRRNLSCSKNSCRDSNGSWCYSIRVIRCQDAGSRMSGRLRSSSSSN